MTPPRPLATPILWVVLIGTLWGLNWPAVKFMLAELPPFSLRALAFPLAAMALAIIARLQGLPLRPVRADWWPILYTGALVVFGFNALTSLGQTLTETSRAAIIAYTMPALTAGLAVFFLGEKLERRKMLALLVGMSGLAFLASENLDALLAEPLGPLIMLLAALSWAAGNVALKSRQWSLPALSLTVWFFVAATLLCWPLVLWFEPPWQQTMPGKAVMLTLVFHVMGPMVVCYTLWTSLLERLPATTAALATLLAPFVGVVSSVVFLGDAATWQKLVALTLILCSIALTLKPSKSPASS